MKTTTRYMEKDLNIYDTKLHIDFSKYKNQRLDEAIRDLKRRFKHLNPMKQSNSITCGERKNEDYKYFYLGKIDLKRETDIVNYKIYIEFHSFFNPKIVFIKNSKGRLGYQPEDGHIHNSQTFII